MMPRFLVRRTNDNRGYIESVLDRDAENQNPRKYVAQRKKVRSKSINSSNHI